MGTPLHKGSKMLYKRTFSSESKSERRMICKVTEKNSLSLQNQDKQKVMQLGMHLCMKGRDRTKQDKWHKHRNQWVKTRGSLVFNKKAQWVLITNNRVQVCSLLSAEKLTESFHWIHSRCAYTVVAFYVMLMNLNYSK